MLCFWRTERHFWVRVAPGVVPQPQHARELPEVRGVAQAVRYHLHITHHTEPAQWGKFGDAAGPIRNAKMLEEELDLVVAFPGGAGTADMVRRSKKAGFKVMEVKS